MRLPYGPSPLARHLLPGLRPLRASRLEQAPTSSEGISHG
jgi:hypothetical protein